MRKEVEDRIVEGLRRIWPLTFIPLVLIMVLLVLLFSLYGEEVYDDT